MCNLIHEEIISHPITGSQEGQVRSVLPSCFPLLSMKQSPAGHLYRKSDVAASTIAEEQEEQEEEEEEEPTS